MGKVFKPDLRRRAIRRVYGEALARECPGVEIIEVVEDRKLGLVAVLRSGADQSRDEAAVAAALADFLTPWRWE